MAPRPGLVPGTAVFPASRLDLVPSALLHTLKHYKALHERAVLLTMQTVDVPRMDDDRWIDMHELGKGFHAVCARFGFMEQPSVPLVLDLCRRSGPRLEMMETSFFVGRQKLRPAKASPLTSWRRRLFIVLSNNTLNATEFFGIPPNRAIEVGGHVEI